MGDLKALFLPVERSLMQIESPDNYASMVSKLPVKFLSLVSKNNKTLFHFFFLNGQPL